MMQIEIPCNKRSDTIIAFKDKSSWIENVVPTDFTCVCSILSFIFSFSCKSNKRAT